MVQELSIKTEGDVLVVLGKQELKEGGQTYVSKQFEQRYHPIINPNSAGRG
jgi:hypothetical protein